MGLRERKKQKTARAIEDAAVRLFGERGFHATTLADIAEAAEISPRTFFSYFPSKESVLFGDFDQTFFSLAEHLDAREDRGVLAAIRQWIVDLVAAEGVPDERARARQEIIDSTEELQGYERRLTSRFEAVIAQAVAEDLGAGAHDLHPRLIAAATAAALTALRPPPGTPLSPTDHDPLATLDDALAFLDAGMTALRERAEPGTAMNSGRQG